MVPMTPTAPVYVVDDDASVREAVGRLVRSAGWTVETFGSAQEFLASPWADVPGCLILDVRLPGLSGLDLQERLAKSGARTPIIFLTGHGDIPTSVRAIKAGALEFLTKPYADADLLAAIEQAFAGHEREQDEARARADRLDARVQSVAGGRDGGRPALGQSAEWKRYCGRRRRWPRPRPLFLLQGESGTGKEVVARFIHRASPRKGGRSSRSIALHSRITSWNRSCSDTRGAHSRAPSSPSPVRSRWRQVASFFSTKSPR